MCCIYISLRLCVDRAPYCAKTQFESRPIKRNRFKLTFCYTLPAAWQNRCSFKGHAAINFSTNSLIITCCLQWDMNGVHMQHQTERKTQIWHIVHTGNIIQYCTSQSYCIHKCAKYAYLEHLSQIMTSSHASSNKWHQSTDCLTLLHCQYYNVFITNVFSGEVSGQKDARHHKKAIRAC